MLTTGWFCDLQPLSNNKEFCASFKPGVSCIVLPQSIKSSLKEDHSKLRLSQSV